MKVKDRMTYLTITIGLEDTVKDAVQLMKTHNIRRLPVLDRGKLTGMITRSNLYMALPAVNNHASPTVNEQWMARTSIKTVMPQNQDLITISPEASIEQGAVLLRDNKVGGLPVVDEEGHLVGMLSVIDILGAFLDMLGVNQAGTTMKCAVNDNLEFLSRALAIMHEHKTRLEHVVTLKGDREDKYLVSLRMDADSARPVIDELRESGYALDSITVKR